MNNDDHKFEGRMHGPQDVPETKEGLGVRLLFMVLIWFMIQFGITLLGALTLLQFVLMVIGRGKSNAQIADLGEGLGIWIAKASRYLVAASDVKPWPWTEFD